MEVGKLCRTEQNLLGSRGSHDGFCMGDSGSDRPLAAPAISRFCRWLSRKCNSISKHFLDAGWNPHFSVGLDKAVARLIVHPCNISTFSPSHFQV